MKRNYIILAGLSLLLIFGAILAGFLLLPANSDARHADDLSIAPPHLTGPAHMALGANPEFFTFGDQSGQMIFLRLTSPQPESPTRFTLVGSTPGLEINPEQAQKCSLHTRLVSPPPNVEMSVSSAVQSTSTLENLKNWLMATVDKQYAITMWSPSSQVNEYHLVSANDSHVGSCAQFLDEDV